MLLSVGTPGAAGHSYRAGPASRALVLLHSCRGSATGRGLRVFAISAAEMVAVLLRRRLGGAAEAPGEVRGDSIPPAGSGAEPR